MRYRPDAKEFVEFLQEQKNFTVTISNDAGAWHCLIDNHEKGVAQEGHGQSFGAAWHEATRSRGIPFPG